MEARITGGILDLSLDAQAHAGQAPPESELRAPSPEQKSQLDSHKEWVESDFDPREEEIRRIRIRDWSGIDLRDRCLKRAELRAADLRGAWLEGANLREADLSRARLDGVVGLSVESLGGADLRGVKLPADIEGFAGLKTVEEASLYLQGLYKIILALCAFNVLTVLSFRDEQLLTHGGLGMTQVPLINAAVSTGMFAVVAPIIIFLFQLYFAIYAHYLWKELSFLPAYFPDGTTLDRRAYPTLFNTFVRLHFHRLKVRAADWAQAIVSTFLIFGIAPLAIGVSWTVFLARHDMAVSSFQALILVFSVGLSMFCLFAARPIMRQDWSPWLPPIPWRQRDREERRIGLLLIWSPVLVVVAAMVASLAVYFFEAGVLVYLSYLWVLIWVLMVLAFLTLTLLYCRESTRESFRSKKALVPVLCVTSLFPGIVGLVITAEPTFDGHNRSILVADKFNDEDVSNQVVDSSDHPQGVLIMEPYWTRRWSANLIQFPLLWLFQRAPFLDLSGKVISARPDGGTGKLEAGVDELNGVVGADLEGADLRSVNANRIFLAQANLHGVNFDHANLRNADLRGADLREATFRGAILRNANLKGAWMFRTDLSGALLGGDDPFEPNQEGKVNLQQARLEGVICSPNELRKTRNYALAFYGIRNGLELIRLWEARFDRRIDGLTNDARYEASLRGLRDTPNSLGIDVRYKAQWVRIRQLKLIQADSKMIEVFSRDLDGFVKRNRANIARITVLDLGYRTDDQLLSRQMSGYSFAKMNLRGADLMSFDLKGACFRHANLRAARLDDTDLRGADFQGADLRGTNFARAKLDMGTNFKGATLTGADLSGIDLSMDCPLTPDQYFSARVGKDDRRPKF